MSYIFYSYDLYMVFHRNNIDFASSVEDTIRKLTKEMKKYIGALENLDRADQRLSTNLINCGLAQNNDEYRKIVEEYSSVAVQVGAKYLDIFSD